MDNIIRALIGGRKINQWEHMAEFKTTRLGGFIHAIRKKGLNVESKELKSEGSGKPPVEYFCTEKSINDFLSK